MKNIIKSLSKISLAALVGCSSTSKIATLKPEPSNNAPVVYKNTTSFVSMPLDITLKEIENQVNKGLKDLVYEDIDMKDDKTEMKIWKTAPIKLIEKDGKIRSVLPLKIWMKVKYGTDFLGLNDTRELNLNGTITLLSNVKFSNWNLTTQSSIEDFNWSESPTISVSGKNVPITYIINPTLSIFKSKIAKTIDDAIAKSCDFKPYVLDVLQTMSKPFLTSEQYETWFKLIPLEVYATDAALKKSMIAMNLGLKCNMQTMVGQQPSDNFDRTTVQFKAVTKIADNSSASIAAVSTYESASRIMSKNFQGKEFGSGNRKITVKDVSLWAKNGKMIIALAMTGSLDGTIYLTGIPNYNAITKEIYFDDLDYVLDTKGFLTKTANWLLHGTILTKIKENCRYSIKENLEEGRKTMLPYLSNYSPMKGVFVNGSLNDLDFEKVELTDKAIVAFIKANGKMTVSIDGMD